MKDLVWKIVASKNPTVDLDLSLDELLITSGMVSKIEVRDGKIGDPLAAVSQYRRFC